MSARCALICFSGSDEIGFIIAAAGTAEAVRPLAFGQIPETVFLAAKAPPELSDSHGRIHSLPPLKTRPDWIAYF